MSHFTVLVITKKDGPDVDELLAPYDENISVEPYIGRTKAEMIADAKKSKENIENRIKEDPKYKVDEWAKKYLEATTDEEFYQTQVYEDSEYDKDGNELSTYNPKSKWDWYSIGGRWDGELKTKSGEYVNECFASELDISIDKEAYNKAIRFWEVIVEEQPLKENESKDDFRTFWNKNYYTSKYADKYAYAKSVASFRTYAFVTPDGEWHEPGQMGWFGCSSDDAESNMKYDEEFEELLENLEDTDELHIVDCHI